MPRPDDERRTNQAEAQRPRFDRLVKVFDHTRRPKALENVLGELWEGRFGENSEQLEFGKPLFTFRHSWRGQPGIYLALEHLRMTGEIPDAAVFDVSGRLRIDAHPHDVAALFGREGILEGKKVVVFGGPEAEIFQAMGAEAVGYDPVFGTKYAQSIQWTARQLGAEIEEQIDLATSTDNGWADLTYSSMLFDPGSDLVDSDTGRHAYTMNLWVVLNLTKPGGLSIHDGNGMVAAILPEFDRWPFERKTYSEIEGDINREVIIYKAPARIVEIAPHSKDDKVGSQETTYVLQRKAG